MPRISDSQRSRSKSNPLVLGTFSSLTLRHVTGVLGPKNQLVGKADTWDTSNGGFGQGAYNHWFQVNITSSAWLILAKGGSRPDRIQVSAYDQNLVPLESRAIWQEDSIRQGSYVPYLDHVVGAAADLYNESNPNRLDGGNDMYFPLQRGAYLICVSTTRNEPLDYALGIVVEFPTEDLYIQLEDTDGSVLLLEGEIDDANTITIPTPVTIDYTVPTGFNAFSNEICQVNSGVTVTVSANSEWFIGVQPTPAEANESKFKIEVTDTFDYNSIHDHSLSEWQAAWNATHQDTDKFPALFVPLTNRA